MFVDEAEEDEHTVSQKYGCLVKGVCCVVQRQFVRGMQYLIVPLIMLDGIIAYDIVDGPLDSECLFKFIKDHVMPFMNPCPGPCSMLIMDNCRKMKIVSVVQIYGMSALI
ncbi:hypothetical protein PAXRUDRAFT_140711 [Paxillus rubicundulus Ve08.2h10]|uniref:Unplaced genomic scaffold scaffold_221, whole genome shotgun sequence n=1 Tax=Paxillus rubicundulus Ve08.2h10 TaxID=930991 RepID=A0A0D0DDN2_9AGAM|nr:hypothetical protein PAXRUDRAFT_140711 [Paxillus rubicundulus Ve08.2h10]